MYDIDTHKYDEDAKDTVKLFVKSYPWYQTPVSLHIRLMHGNQIIEELCIPIGHAWKEELEATHKITRKEDKGGRMHSRPPE